jgi:hypothetical protein
MGDFVILQFEERMGIIEKVLVFREDFRIRSDKDFSCYWLKISKKAVRIERGRFRLRSVACSEVDFHEKAEKNYATEKNDKRGQIFLHHYLTNKRVLYILISKRNLKKCK